MPFYIRYDNMDEEIIFNLTANSKFLGELIC